MKRTQISHAPLADQMRQQPWEWLMVRAYPARYSATSTALAIRTAHLPKYSPAGAFEAEVRTVDGDATVFARYTGGAR